MRSTPDFCGGWRVLPPVLVAGCGKSEPAGPAAAAGGVEAASAKSKQQFGQTLNLADKQDFGDAERGLIARPSGKVLNADGATVWDYDRFTFLKGDAPVSADPSLWRQAKLSNNVGLYKVMDGIYQLRGFDLANITLIEGKTAWIVVDTLTSRLLVRFFGGAASLPLCSAVDTRASELGGIGNADAECGNCAGGCKRVHALHETARDGACARGEHHHRVVGQHHRPHQASPHPE